MNILIIGSKGFIGSVCYNFFKDLDGYDVYGADVVTEYNDPNYFLIDATNADFKSVFRKHQFTWCVNCAGAASVPDSFIRPEKDYLLNVNLTVALLNAIREENNDCKFLQMSSAAVYGNPVVMPIKETDRLAPLSPYGIHKKQAEELCELYHKYYGLSIFIFRVFSAYGRGLQKQLFWDLFKKSRSQQHFALFGTGEETREFIHVTDIVNAMSLVISGNQTGFKIINIANGSPITIAAAASAFLENIEFKGVFSFEGVNRSGDPLYWQADTSLLKSLGYQQQISFEDGIKDYCKWLKERG
ncbi:NAD-dependent epimerase/dehydratase family protein [Mucilaginibacter kameinonensis]|uniref:NAD-dependent epimerase/dehydratase family protein n=1 Tax=Mucilaginibacter kameinonensis TaxID=452286 RepID=UPI000EF7D9D2|nr:SDR family oxidoreductase [Mucilaginibacter kameinonensis]